MKLLRFTIGCLSMVVIAFSIHHQQLGQSCEKHDDCAAAYSLCDTGRKCVCRQGFTTDGELCIWPTSFCPHPVGRDASPSSGPCDLYFDPDDRLTKSTCRPGEYCLLHPDARTAVGHERGSCCPDVPAATREPGGGADLLVTCPVGVANGDGTCPDYSHLPADAPAEDIRTCSRVDEKCVWHQHRAACCPRPCLGSSDYFNVEGKCYRTAMIGDKCTYDVQCIANSNCLKIKDDGDKICACNSTALPAFHWCI